jgi:cytoskeletal protein RodZ
MPEGEELFSEFFNERLKKRGLTLPQLSELSGISLKHLEQFAHGRFENMPASPYLRGYFVRLGSILGFEPLEWWERVRHDGALSRSGGTDTLPKNRFHMRENRAMIGLGVILLLVALYFGLRATKIIGKPDLEVTAPKEDTTRTSESHIFISGTMKNGDEVDICLEQSCEQIPLDTDGVFQRDVQLVPGMNTVKIMAKKILGRTTTVTRQVYYDASPIQILIPQAPATTTITSSTRPSASSTGNPGL